LVSLKLQDRLKYEKNFIESNPILLSPSEGEINKSDLLYKFIERYDKFSVIIYNEVFKNPNALYKVCDIIDKSKKEVLISTSTTTENYLFMHPLSNLYFWQGSKHKSKINWDCENINWFDKSLYTNFTKSVKGIISVRKNNYIRTRIFNKIKDFEGICRYANWVHCELLETEEVLKLVNNFPTITELISEYLKSYVSFVIETYQENEIQNQLSDKTLFAFLSKTMPIVYGGKNYIKELKKMGFYVWNDEFGYGEGDNYHSSLPIKINNFSNCIDNYNRYSLDDISLLYKLNKEKIEKNFEIAKIVLENRDWWEKNVKELKDF
jgi:hypothetical protein